GSGGAQFLRRSQGDSGFENKAQYRRRRRRGGLCRCRRNQGRRGQPRQGAAVDPRAIFRIVATHGQPLHVCAHIMDQDGAARNPGTGRGKGAFAFLERTQRTRLGTLNMDLCNLRASGNVDDRRGAFGGYLPHLAFGGGGLGRVAVDLISILFGVDPSALLGGGTVAPVSQNAGPGAARADDAAMEFSRKIIGSAEDVWSPLLQQRGVSFTPATFTAYDNATPTGCGTGQASAGPFYCPEDRHIYLDLSFFNELATRFGASGDFARAYVIAHEYGHHV